MDNYKYTFTYQNEDKILTKTLNADININDLKQELRLFLLGCSWSESVVSFLEEDPEEAIESSVRSEYYDWASDYIDKAQENGYKADKILEDIRNKFL